MSAEEVLWNDNPSQVSNFGTFIYGGLFFWLVFPPLIMLWKWLEIKNVKYELTNQRLKVRRGILSKKTDELELYRIKDYQIDEPFFLRLFSLSNIILSTSDRSHPTVHITAIKNAEEIRETIRSHVEELRDRKRVREVDFE